MIFNRLCVCVHLCIHTQWQMLPSVQKRVFDPFELQLQVVVSLDAVK